MPISGPTVVRRQLGRRLQRLREVAGKTVTDVETANLGSRTKIWRIEAGKVPVKVPDVWALARLYGVDETETEVLARMALGTAEQGWWEDYADVVPDWFKLYVGLEAAAATIHTFEDSVIPGELQTADYAEAIYRAAQPDDSDEAIGRHVQVRLDRQRGLFGRTPPPQMIVVLGQSVLTRPVGGPQVLAEQIKHLHDLDQHPHIEIRVLTFDSGAHAAMTGAFRILDFADDEDPDVVYLEEQVGARYLEKAGELAEYRRILKLIYQQAVPIGEFTP